MSDKERPQLRPQYGDAWKNRSKVVVPLKPIKQVHTPQPPRTMAPEYVLNEMEFLNYIAAIMIHGDSFTEDQIKKMWENDKICSYKSVFGSTPISILLAFRAGIKFDKEYQVWYTGRHHEKFLYSISKTHWENEKEFGKDYDRPWLHIDDEWIFD